MSLQFLFRIILLIYNLLTLFLNIYVLPWFTCFYYDFKVNQLMSLLHLSSHCLNVTRKGWRTSAVSENTIQNSNMIWKNISASPAQFFQTAVFMTLHDQIYLIGDGVSPSKCLSICNNVNSVVNFLLHSHYITSSYSL